MKRFLKSKIKAKKEMSGINPQLLKSYDHVENVEDIDLNLDKYIFNFDESLLKFINIKEVHKNDFKDNAKNDDNDNNDFNINNNTSNKKLKIN